MKAFVINKYGKDEQLHLTDIPEPSLGEDEVLVEIHAAGLNQLDSKIKSGAFKLILSYKLPLILGHDLAGVVVKVGSQASRFKVGDEVYARPADYHIGTFAEYLAVNEKDLARKPKNLTMDEAGSLPLVALTAWQALVEFGKLKQGQKVFIQAGSGGVGIIAIQLAKYLGATVATTAGSGSFELLKQLGADILIDYKTQDFESVLKDYDLVINSQDTRTLEKSLNIVKAGGKVISISGPPTPELAKSIDSSRIMRFVLSLISFGIRRKAKKRGIVYEFLFMRASGRQLEEITKLVESGVIKTVLDRVFTFEQTNEALAYLEKGRAKGKVVVNIK
ncbi:NADP-dependent oxidoreductase [Bacteroides reticulotermitis]|uniref:Zinc-containing alcohol dehydrogenase n=2 Tax=Bacteroides reticulotermitis TaxID=1133319 RepID=W4URV9_9BACE|nr:NADP-dependent oxidoreductase [Bacteroides reticulotermitis]MBB4043504.1 NADPH:quinone reductase-like Zn-dependent oxidoreductase [Bacteroides reticulotermitis]GAE83522.1 zinc-containing alcohol dehydrogenase [Bacteroides reticulotermitis JCM 10512]